MSDRPAREPVFNIPRVVLVVIVVMAAIHGGRTWLPDRTDAALLVRFAFVPGRLTALVDAAAVLRPLAAAIRADPSPDGAAAVAAYFFDSGSPQPWAAVTYALLHGSWTHLGLNAVWLLAFGAPVARRLGAVRFLGLFAAGAVAGAATQLLVAPLSLQPLIGASAAVSACMGAALRFMFQPGRGAGAAAIAVDAGSAPRRGLQALMADRRAAAFLAVWFVSNVVTGVVAVPLGLTDAPIAWQAHIGGFLLGLLALPLFDRAPLSPARASPQVSSAPEA